MLAPPPTLALSPLFITPKLKSEIARLRHVGEEEGGLWGGEVVFWGKGIMSWLCSQGSYGKEGLYSGFRAE